MATAKSACSTGISAIGIYTAPGVLAYSTPGSSLNTLLNLSPGYYQTVVQDWDNCGKSSKTSINITVSARAAEVQVTAPSNNATVATQVQYVATATSPCAKGVSAMGIYTAPGILAYEAPGANLNALLTLNAGTYHTVVQEWDNCGASASTPITIQVGGQSSGGQVSVTAPQPNSTVSSSVEYIASATSSCSKGVSAMGIYTAPGVLAYSVSGAKLNTSLTLGPGTYHTVVEEWDNCGQAATTPITITVGGSGGTSGTFSNLQQQTGWNGYALLPSLYDICDSCAPSGPQTTWAMTHGISSPSRSGNSSRMDIGGQTVYSDVLWNNHLIGDFSSQGMPDTNKTIVPSLHNFTYDVYFYVDDASVSQALEL